MTHNSILHTWQLAGSALMREQRALNTLTVNLKNDLYDESSFIQLSTEYTLRGRSNCFPAEHHSSYYHEITAKVWNITSCALTSVAHFDHWSPLQLSETVFNALVGTLPKARVTQVHPVQPLHKALWKLFCLPIQSFVLVFFAAIQPLCTQNKQQFNK